MDKVFRGFAVSVGIVLLASSAQAGFPKSPLTKCANDAVVAGTVCMDKYEASVWQVPDPTGANKGLVKRIMKGQATEADLTAAGATQLGTVTDDYDPCTDNGQTSCTDVFAVSLLGVTPSAGITWFQAQEACANAGKRLPTSAEWQVGANGTPDGAPCNVASGGVAATGTAAGCVSARGAFDMVGNLWEWVADWVPRSTNCAGWDTFSNDYMCLSGADTTAYGPGALQRGGPYSVGVGTAGPLAVFGRNGPSVSSHTFGFRCAR